MRRGRRLEYLTVGWNILEWVVAIGSGLVAGSIVLVGFGFDSFIEALSGGALVWRFRSDEGARTQHDQQERQGGTAHRTKEGVYQR